MAGTWERSPESLKKMSDSKKSMWATPGFKEWYFTHAKPRKPRTRSGGYWRVYNPTHPRADVKGYVIEQRLIMEQHLGRPLRDDEIVHHHNHDKYDNRIENLAVVTHSEHAKIHHRTFSKPHRFPCKLSFKQVKEIRALYDGKYGSQTRLAKQYGVSPTAIHDIVKYRRRTQSFPTT